MHGSPRSYTVFSTHCCYMCCRSTPHVVIHSQRIKHATILLHYQYNNLGRPSQRMAARNNLILTDVQVGAYNKTTILQAWWLRPRFSSARGYNWHLAEYQLTHTKYSSSLYSSCLKHLLLSENLQTQLIQNLQGLLLLTTTLYSVSK